MNFPASQKTGRRSELKLVDFFLGWDWNAGEDHIDSGYDLCITPEHSRYQGIRFPVQVKGTALSGKGKPAADVSKKRLRQYAVDVLPVFIIRATPEGIYYWIHAQAWIRANPSALIGIGRSRVVFDLSQTLDDRAGFERYLDQVVRPLLARADVLAVGDQNRLIDPQALSNPATPRRKPGSAASKVPRPTPTPPNPPPVMGDAKLTFQPVRTEENMAKVREAIGYGLPRSFKVENFVITPPPGFPQAKGVDASHGQMTVRQLEPISGTVELCPGAKYTVVSQELALASDLFSGTLGSGITNETYPSSLDIKLLLTPDPKGIKLDAHLGIRASVIGGKPLKDFRDLRTLATWAEQVAAQDALQLSLNFAGERQQLPAFSPISPLLLVLQRIRCMSRLHMVARALDSPFVLPADLQIAESDLQDINLAFELLKGERKLVNLGPMEVDGKSKRIKALIGKPLEFFCTTNWEFELGGQRLGTIPIQIHLPEFEAHKVPGTSKVSITKGVNGKAWMTYAEHGDTGVFLTRNRH